MSSERKFQVIEKKQVGTLPGRARAQLKTLRQRQAHIEKLQARLDADTMKFGENVRKFAPLNEDAQAYRGFHVDPAGDVYEVYCKCPPCQADLQGVSVLTVIDEMRRQNMTQPNEVHEIRKALSKKTPFRN